MAEVPVDHKARFLQRIERRAKFLKTLLACDMAIYLPSEEKQRRQTIEQVVRMTARHSELPHLGQDTLAEAYNILLSNLEDMQRVLPHDVQYRNRIKRNW
jgi:hypothetical protein